MSTPKFQGDGAHAGEAPASGAYAGEAATASGAHAGANASPAAQAGAANAALGHHAPSAPVGVAVPHESADEHVTGAALYTDELCSRTQGVLHAWPVQAPHAHARVLSINAEEAMNTPGVVRVLTHADVPGQNDAGTKDDEPLLPTEVMYHGHAVCWVLGESLEAARLGAEAVQIDSEPLPAILTLTEAIAAGSNQGKQPTIARGEAATALQSAPHTFTGEFEFGGQEHFYLETHAALAQVDEAGQVFVHSSTQHPSETQEIVEIGRAH